MRKNFIPVVVFLGVLILGLLVWNVYLINEVKLLKNDQKEINLRNQILEGDNDVLSYDLVTCRDSLRILNKKGNKEE